MTHPCCRVPMSFFHTTPMGRIINRLTKDTSDVDKNLADFASFFLRSAMQLLSTVALIGFETWFTLPALAPILLAFYLLYAYFQVRPPQCCVVCTYPCWAPLLWSMLRYSLRLRCTCPGGQPRHWAFKPRKQQQIAQLMHGDEH